MFRQTGALQVDHIPILPLSGVASSSGNNTVVTPTSGYRLQFFHVSYNPTAGAVEAAFRFGASGALFLKYSVPQYSVIMKDYGPRCIVGATDEALVLNLSAAIATNWTVHYVEIL